MIVAHDGAKMAGVREGDGVNGVGLRKWEIARIKVGHDSVDDMTKAVEVFA